MNYEKIINQLQDDLVIKLMYQLGIKNCIEREDCIIFPTICHNPNSTKASEKLYFYRDTKLFVCYTECGNMSIFKFLTEYYKTRGIHFDWVEDVYKVVLNCSLARNLKENSEERYESRVYKYKKKKSKALDIYDKKVLGVFQRFYPPEWISDGIEKETMDKFNILYSISQNKIIIPHYDSYDNLVGIRGRALNQWEVENIGKYMPVKIEGKWYKHPLSLNLYGINTNKENIRKNGYVYLVESEKSVLQMESFNEDNCALAVCGSNFNKYQLKLLMKECCPREIIICFDNEEEEGSDKYFHKLRAIGEKYQNYCDFSFIYDRERILEPKDSPTDKGEEIFNELKKRRVKVK